MPPFRPTILFIDDDPISLALMQQYLVDSPYAVELAEDGEQAWSLLSQPKKYYAAIVLDRVLPGLDSLQFLQRLKTNPMLRQIPVIMLTGSAQKEEVIAAFKAGIFDFLMKPLEKDLLLLVLRRALRQPACALM